MSVSDGSPIKHVGLRLSMSVSDRSPMRHVGVPEVSDSNTIFVNSYFKVNTEPMKSKLGYLEVVGKF